MIAAAFPGVIPAAAAAAATDDEEELPLEELELEELELPLEDEGVDLHI